MEHPFDTLLKKAKAVHYKWIWNYPQSEQIEAMSQLGDAIQDAEATKSIPVKIDVLDLRAFRVLSSFGDRQLLRVALGKNEMGVPSITLEIRTLTRTPEKYGYDAILRRINGYFYIRNTFAMRADVWSVVFMATIQMKDATTMAMKEYLDKKEKAKMHKYIDSEELKAEIESRRLSNRHVDTEGYENELLEIIDSLPHEQPELPGYDKALLEVKRVVDKLYDETSIGLNEYDSGLYNGIAETCMKLRGFIKARLDSNEQPEVDLEKAFAHEYAIYHLPNFIIASSVNGTELIDFIYETARHFYELGLNARKEGAK